MNHKRTIPTLSVILYGFAAVMLLAAISILLTALAFNRTSGSSMPQLLEAYGPVAGLLAELLKSSVGILGIVFAGMVMTMSALLFTAGQLLIHSNNLSQRVAVLETKLDALTKPE